MHDQAAFFVAADLFACLIRSESKTFAFCSSARRAVLSPRPARLMKYVSIRMPDPGPFGETRLEASVRAIVAALFVNNPAGGWVESVFTLATQRFFFWAGIGAPFSHRTSLNLRLDATEAHEGQFNKVQREKP